MIIEYLLNLLYTFITEHKGSTMAGHKLRASSLILVVMMLTFVQTLACKGLFNFRPTWPERNQIAHVPSELLLYRLKSLSALLLGKHLSCLHLN